MFLWFYRQKRKLSSVRKEHYASAGPVAPNGSAASMLTGIDLGSVQPS